MAITRAWTDPTRRPMTPKCAPELTALFVPVLGPMRLNTAKNTVPKATPTVTDVNDAHQLSPKTTGSQPRRMLPKVICAPIQTQNRFRGLELRSAVEM